MATSPFSRFYTWLTEQVDWRFTWHKLPLPLGLLDLIGLRIWRMQCAECHKHLVYIFPSPSPFDMISSMAVQVFCDELRQHIWRNFER